MSVAKFLMLFVTGVVVSGGAMFGLVTGRFSSPPATATGNRVIEEDHPVNKMLVSSGLKNNAADKAAGTRYSRSGYDVTPLAQPAIDKLAKKLDPKDAEVILAKGTERPFCDRSLHDNKTEGAYACKLCGLPLFASDAKFNSGTGWPSFFQPFDKDHIRYERDGTLTESRVEIMCARCGGHLGHVFEDGPKPTGLRYCLNSASLNFTEKKEGKVDWPEISKPIKTEIAYFGGGCFWGVEDRFQQTPGVVDAVSGFMGGTVKGATYMQVCREATGHAEVVKIAFDPTRITYKELLAKFFKYHDPTQFNRQGPDIGDQYRSAIFTVGADQAAAAKTFIEEQAKSERFKSRKIVTQVIESEKVPEAGAFIAAEEYHQDYHQKHGGHCSMPPE